MLADDFLAEWSDGGDISSVKDVVDCSVAELFSGFFELGFGAPCDDDFFAARDEPFRFGFSEATRTACDESALEVEGFGSHVVCLSNGRCEIILMFFVYWM